MHIMVNAINSDRFHVENWLTYGSTPINTSFKLEPEQQIAMVDAVLQLFTTLLGVRTYLGKKLFCQEIYQPIWKHWFLKSDNLIQKINIKKNYIVYLNGLYLFFFSILNKSKTFSFGVWEGGMLRMFLSVKVPVNIADTTYCCIFG